MNRKLLTAFMAMVALGMIAANSVFAGTVRIYENNGTTLVRTLTISNVLDQDYKLPATTMASGSAWSFYASASTWAKAIMYMDYTSGTMLFDPKGIQVGGMNINWGGSQTTSAVSVNSGSSGPFVYWSGSAAQTVGTIFPAGTYLAPPTTWAARYGGAWNSLATSGTSVASTAGSLDLAWSFGAIAPGVTTEAQIYTNSFASAFRSPLAGGNLVGTGTGMGMFYYTTNPGTGNQYSLVVPITSVSAVPEPSMIMLAGIGIATLGYARIRRQRRQCDGGQARKDENLGFEV